MCYLKTNVNRTKAVKYLERAKATGKYDKELPYYLGLGYALNYQLDLAIKSLNEYLASPGKMKEEAQKRKSDCLTAKELMRRPVKISYENMGPKINSKYPDYYPFISGNETVLSYTSRRKNGKGKLEYDGYYSSDVFLSKFNGSAFSKGTIMSSLNSPYNEQSTGLSSDGETMFFYSDYRPEGELYLVTKKGNSFGKKDKILNIDEEKFLESAVCLSPDGNVMIYSSNKENGNGGFDLWMVRKLPFGKNKWAAVQNLGNVVNTPGDEDFPSFGPDGRTIYFSSNGHRGMGGWDLYKTVWDPTNNTFSKPQNLGYPLNTPDDEKSISFASDGKHAYISAQRPEGEGDLDIYRITYEKVELPPALFSVKLTGTTKDGSWIAASSLVILDSNGKRIGQYSPNPNTFEYTIILPPGNYKIEIDATEYGYEFYSNSFGVDEFMNRMGRIDKVIHLQKDN